jgi:hypothetical protein
MQSVTITTNVMNLNPVHGELYLIQLYVIKFVSELRQVCGFLWVLLITGSPTIYAHIHPLNTNNTITYNVINPGPGLGQAQHVAGLNW